MNKMGASTDHRSNHNDRLSDMICNNFTRKSKARAFMKCRYESIAKIHLYLEGGYIGDNGFSALSSFFGQKRRPHKRTLSLIIYLKDQCLTITNFLHRVFIRDHRHAFCILPMLLPQHVRNPVPYAVRIGSAAMIH